MTVHAGVLLRYVPLTAERTTGIVSRGGSILAAWCLAHHQENFLYTHYEELCEIFAAYDVAFSLGDGLRPGSIADANDTAQMAELETLGELTGRAWAHDVQVMIEGPGHVPLNKIKENVTLEREWCQDAPFYTLGSAHHRHCAGLRPHHLGHRGGQHRLVRNGHALLRNPQGALGTAQPGRRERRGDGLQDRCSRRRCGQGPSRGAGVGQRSVESPVRVPLGRSVSTCLSTPRRALKYHDETLPAEPAKTAHFCSMCGPKFCSMKITQDVRDYAPARGWTSRWPSSWG